MTSLRQSKKFAQFMKLSGWIVEKVDNVYVYIRKIPFFPPLIMKVQYPTPPIPFVQIEKLAQKYKPLKIQIQPLKIELGLKKYGYRPSKEVGHVTKTTQIDLTQSEEKILKQMKKDARYSIGKAKEKDTKILRYKEIKGIGENSEVKTLQEWADALLRGGGNIKTFQRAWRKSVGWQKYVPSLKTLQNLQKAFGQNAVFLMAKSDKDTPELGKYHPRGWRKKHTPHGLVAGTLILITNQTAYYYYAFTSKEGRKNFAQYLLVWEAIKLAKKKNCKIFDFEGIYDERFPIKSWQGFSHFKKSFGGKKIEYPSCWVKYRPFFWFRTRKNSVSIL